MPVNLCKPSGEGAKGTGKVTGVLALVLGCFLSPPVAVAQPRGISTPLGQSIAQSMGKVTGTVSYLQRIALPPNAVVEVRLQEVSRLDAPAVTLTEQIIETAGRQVPFAFELSYDPNQIDSRYTYVVQARITVDGELRWINTTAYPVITRGAPTTVEVRVEQVPASPSSPTPSPSASREARYDCKAQVSRYRDAENVSLEAAQRLLLQRDGKKFAYQCTPATSDFRYDCRPQVASYPDRNNVTLGEAERLMIQRAGDAFVYQCAPR